MVNRLISSLPLLDLWQPLYNKTTSPSLTEPTVPAVVLPDDVLFTELADGIENTTTSHPDSISAVDGLPDAADLIVRVCLYAVIFVFAVVGNVLVLVTLVQNKRMRTVTNVFLVNLAVSDLLLGVFCMPFTLIGSLLRNFVFGELMCKFIPYLQARRSPHCLRTVLARSDVIVFGSTYPAERGGFGRSRSFGEVT
ncbi:hypothetical protein HPB49_015315 [Dermacentor silvarum]|uniref:Uncharacterized protein n=1 Tax=Dermacentor silvarum TaxID=543639 RepID=A0ACB8CXV2_DERSI|nr:hypothetical protein HPB49_015315 [Dermacentor silvarum]